MVSQRLGAIDQLGAVIDQEALAFQSPDARRIRREAIAHNRNLLRKMSALSIHLTAPLFAHAVQRRFATFCEDNGYQYLGSGAQASALLSPDGEVVKILRASVHDSSLERHLQASAIKELIDRTTVCHNDEALPTGVDTSFTLTKGRTQLSYVALRQRYVEGVCALRHPAATKAVKQFAERTLDTMVPQGYASDVLGENNLQYTNGRIVLVDTIPLVADSNPPQPNDTYSQNLKRLRELANAT